MLEFLRARLPVRRVPAAFGLDIGSTAVKVLELRPTGSSPAVARCARIPLAAGAVAEGTIRDAAAAAAAIRRAVDAAGITTRRAAVGVCGRELIVKKLQIPRVPARELADAIRIEAEHQIPFAVEEVFLGYQITAQRNRLVDLTLVAAKKAKIMEYHAAVSAAGLVPVVVDVDGFALGNQHELGAGSEGSPEATAGAVALVDIGATMTKIAIVGRRLTHFVRDVPLGGDRYTRAIATRLGVAVDEAEALKIGVATSPDPELVAQVCAGISRDLGREIQRALDYHAESDVSVPPAARVSLVGGGAALGGLDQSLASFLGLPVAVADPFAGLAVDAACAGVIAGDGLSLALALGLALRRSGDSVTP
jgi:type IV pilus assembly protein PilM